MLNDELAERLRRQHQVVTWQQLLTAVGSRHAADRLIRLGVLTSPRHNVWKLSGSSATFQQQVITATLACGPSAAAARWTAAHLLGIRGGRAPDVIQVVVPHHHGPTPLLPGVRRHRSRTLTPAHIVEVEGVPCTSAARTITDLSITCNETLLRDLVARGLRESLVTLPALSYQLEEAGRIRGARRLRVVLGSLDGNAAMAQSRAEQVLFDALVAAGFTTVVRQHAVQLPSGVIRLDLAIVEERLAIEVDGFWWHSTPQQKASDERRQNELVAAAWRPLRFGAGLVLACPDRAVAQVCQAVARP